LAGPVKDPLVEGSRIAIHKVPPVALPLKVTSKVGVVLAVVWIPPAAQVVVPVQTIWRSSAKAEVPASSANANKPRQTVTLSRIYVC